MIFSEFLCVDMSICLYRQIYTQLFWLKLSDKLKLNNPIKAPIKKKINSIKTNREMNNKSNSQLLLNDHVIKKTKSPNYISPNSSDISWNFLTISLNIPEKMTGLSDLDFWLLINKWIYILLMLLMLLKIIYWITGVF